MSNQCIVDVRYFDDDVLVLAEDSYGKTFLSFEPEYFEENFGDNVVSLLRRVSEEKEMDGAFEVDDKDNVVLDCCSSLEVYGLTDDDIIYLRSEQMLDKEMGL